VAFPETPLPIAVEISLDGTSWTDITGDVRSADQIQITRGRSDWGQQTDPGRCSFSLDNRDGKYSPRNPESPYYGQIGRNTPVRISIETGDNALWLPGNTSSDTCAASDTAVLDITGDIDVRLDATLLNWNLADGPLGTGTTSVLTELIGKYNIADGVNQRSWTLVTQDGSLMFIWSEDGTAATGYTVTCSETLPVPPTGRVAVRVTLDVNNGSGGFTCRFYTSDTIDGVWTQLGDTETGGATTSIFNSNTFLQIGNAYRGYDYTPPKGYVHAAEVRNGIDGTIVANPIFANETVGVSSFVDEAGITWSLSGGLGEITNRKVRFVGEISSWTPEWDTGGFDVITRVEASGVLRRLSQGVTPAKSPVYREFTSPFRENVIAYWPMEDGSEATSIASAFDGHPAMSIIGTVTPAAYSEWTASDPVLTIGTGSLKVNVPTYTETDYIFTRVFVAVPAAGVAAEQRLYSFTQTGTAKIWSLYVNTNGSLALRAYNDDGTEILNTGYFLFAVNGDKKSVGIELTQDGSDIDYRIVSYDLTDSTLNSYDLSVITGTLTGYSVGRVTQFRFGEDGLMNDTAFGHLALSDSSTGLVSATNAQIGWVGEKAAARVHRLGIEENISAYTTAFGDQQMGVQARNTIIDLLRNAEDVDQGILGEQRDILGVKLVQRTSLYNQEPTLTLDYEGSDGLVAPLDPVDDDQHVTNDVTVTREGGSFSRATLTTGALSTQDPPNGIGVYDTAHTYHLYDDDQPPHHSGWLLHRGTWDETRFPQVTVDLANAPASITDALLTDFGCLVRITNPPAWLPPGNIDLLVQGYTERFDQYHWTITYNCVPYGPYNVAHEAESPQSLYTHVDTDGSELVEDLTTTETEVDVQVTDGPEWVIAAPSLVTNYDFEENLTGWTANGCTIERVVTPGIPPFLGDWSMKLTPDGVTEFPNVGSDMAPVTVGNSYTFSGWQMCETSRDVDLNVNWFDAGFNYLSTDSETQTLTAGEWTWFQASATAPASAAYVNISPTVANFPPATDVLYSDMLTLRPTVDDELPEDFPFDIRVGGEIMRVTGCKRSVYDKFSTAVAAGSWGTAESGQAWTVSGGPTTDYSVTGGYGAITMSAVNSSRRALITAPSADIDMYVDVTTAATATGGPIFGGPIVRANGNSDGYLCRLEFTTTNTITATLRKRVAGIETQLTTYAVPFTHTPGTNVRVRFQVIGSSIKARVWRPTSLEPGEWNLSTTDTSVTAAGSVGMRSFVDSGNTNVGPQARFDNFKVVNPQTFTVARSVNGVVKTHSAGADVRLAYPAITAL
jgi:hypothetical protein